MVSQEIFHKDRKIFLSFKDFIRNSKEGWKENGIGWSQIERGGALDEKAKKEIIAEEIIKGEKISKI